MNSTLGHRRQVTPSFLQEHTMQIINKSLSHVRKTSFKPPYKLRRNNSSYASNSSEVKQNFLPSNAATDMISSMKMSTKAPKLQQLHNNNMMNSAINNKQMFYSTKNLFSKKPTIKIKVKGDEQKTNSPRTETQMKLDLQKNEINMLKKPIIQSRSPKKMIKIMSSEKMRTPKKEDRPSWSSKYEKNEPIKVEVNKRTVSLFSIKDKAMNFNKKETKNNENHVELQGLGVPVDDSFVIEENKNNKILPKINIDKNTYDRILIPEKNHNNIIEKQRNELKSNATFLKRSLTYENEKKTAKELISYLADTKILSCKFNKTDDLLAFGAEDGITRVMTPDKKSFFNCLSDSFCYSNPANNVRWWPKNSNNILMVTNINGFITHWDVEKKKIIFQHEDSQTIFGADFNIDGTKFAIVGVDTSLKVFHGMNFSSKDSYPGHANRIYAVKFHDTNPEILISGGWDETLLFWDLRVSQKENPINYIYGPLICGEALDINGNYVLTGSWRDYQQLEIWDMRKFQLVYDIEWPQAKKDEKSLIYSAQFSKFSQNYVIGGSSGSNEIAVFKKNENEYECFDIIKNFNKSIYTMDFCYESDCFVFGDGGGDVGLIEIL